MKRTVTSGATQLSTWYHWGYWLIMPCFLALVTLLVYMPSLHYQFQFDDISNITKHFNIRHYTFWQLFFSGTRWLSYWINSLHYAFGKYDPFSYRVFNVCLHIANGIILFFILLYGLSKRRVHDFFYQHAGILATTTALLFLLHPVQTQTVSYVIQGQLEGLAAFFILSMVMTCMCFSYAHTWAVKSFLFITLIALAFFSCCTKEIAIISPALLLLVDWFFMAQGDWHSYKKRLWLYALLALIVVSVYTYLLKPDFFLNIVTLNTTARNNIGNVITHNPADLITPGNFLISQFKVIVHYLWIFIWPFSLSVEYDWMLSASFFALDCLLPFCFLSGLVWWLVRLIQREPSSMVGFGFLWFFVCITPRSSIIPSPELLVDYKTYLASCGWLFMCAAFCVYIGRLCVTFAKVSINNRYAGHIAALILVIPLGIATVQRNSVWRSGLEFWGNVIKNAPGKARAYNNYGVELSQAHHNFKDAIPYFVKAIQMDPNYYDPRNNLAVAYANTDQMHLAIDVLHQGLRVNPYYPEGYNNLASFLFKDKQYDKAEAALHTALKLRPHYGKAYYNLGRIYVEQGKKELAWQHFKDACFKGDLDNDMGFSAYGKMSLMLGKYEEAIFAYNKALECNPLDPDALFNRGNAYVVVKRYDDAIHSYEQCLKVNPQDLRCWYNLGETHLASDRFDLALACYLKASSKAHEFYGYHIRVAQCYESLGNYRAAHQILSEVSHIEAPDQIKSMAVSALTKLERAHPEIRV